jgi:glycosyltransferase involved in cell wall biosynthesis
MLMWRPLMKRWFAKHLPLSHFDLVFITTQNLALAVPDLKSLHEHPFVVNIDATAAANMREFNLASIPNTPFVKAERKVFGAADLVVCMNQWAADSLARDFGLPAERTHVARISIPSPARHAPHDDETRLPRILFVGNDWQRKGGPQLLRLHQQRFADRAELHVCSRGAKPDPAARNVVWHGAVPHDRLMNDVYSSADLFVMPTRLDMVPWAILEAASFGLPIVSTAMAAIPEIVLHEKSGLLCAPGDWDAFEHAIDRLVREPQTRRTMGAAARQHVAERFNPDTEYGNLIERLVELGRSRRGPR